MKLLFIHQNFPGQYLHLVKFLHSRGEHEILGLGEAENIAHRGAIQGITTIGYPTPEGAGAQTHHYLRSTETSVRRGQSVARSLLRLKAKGYTPDVISVHPGWGEALFLRDVYPVAPILMFCEFYFRAGEADLQFDPEFPQADDWGFSVRIRNSAQILSLLTANACLCPTRWQASRYPSFVRDNTHVIHNGIHTAYMCPDPEQTLTIQPLSTPGESRVTGCSTPGQETRPRKQPRRTQPTETEKNAAAGTAAGPPLTLSHREKIVTYVSRNLEPYRGFHVFLRALPDLQRLHPDARILIVGGDGVSYSPALPDKQTYKEKYLAEMRGALDLTRIHFLGRVPYEALRALFRISSAHVYFTYPFVLSWSILEAMACESLLIASRTPPVEEVITHNKHGLLVDFFDQKGLVDSLDQALSNPDKFTHLRRNARRLIVKRYRLEKCLALQADLLHALALGRYPNPE
jgi:glycosyltransferase involved in cell wall biosynthesis